MIEQKITSLLEEKFREEAFTDCYIIDVEINNTKLKVFMDCDHGLSLGKCQKISRFLENHLDEKLWLGEKYTLEVSSPGISRPLKFLRQYQKNVGRNAEVHLNQLNEAGDHIVKKGKIVAVEDGNISLEAKVRVKEGKKKKTVVETSLIPFDEIKKTIIKISFK